MHDGYPQKGGKKCGIVASRENTLVCALSLQLLKEQGLGSNQPCSVCLCGEVPCEHFSWASEAGPSLVLDGPLGETGSRASVMWRRTLRPHLVTTRCNHSTGMLFPLHPISDGSLHSVSITIYFTTKMENLHFK